MASARLIVGIGVVCGLATVAAGADRLAQFEKLDAEYQAASKAFYAAPYPKKPTTEYSITRYESWPAWKYLPQFSKLAAAEPGDAAAYKCCQWMVHLTDGVGNWDRVTYDADENAWTMIAAHHIRNLKGTDYQLACFRAAGRIGEARERLLRAERALKDSSRENRAIAALALAELLSRKFEQAGLRDKRKATTDAFEKYLRDRESSDYLKDCTIENKAKFKAESVNLFQELLKNDAEVQVTATADPIFATSRRSGTRRRRVCTRLEHLSPARRAWRSSDRI